VKRLVALAAVLAAVLAVSAAAAVAPYRWTPALASSQLVRWNPAIFHPEDPFGVDVKSARCGARGPAVQGRYLAFRCAATFKSRSARGVPTASTVWMKVRQQGSGQPCVSLTGLAAIPAGCLRTVGARVAGSLREARAAVTARTAAVLPPECVGYGAGFYLCGYTVADVPGRAAVSFSPTKVSVTLLG